MANSRTHVVASDGTLFSIINHLHENGESGITDIANAQNLSKGAVYKHLNSLTEHEYAIKTNGMYKLSYKFLEIGSRLRDRQKLCDVSLQNVQNLASKIEEMVIFGVRENQKMAFVYVRNDPYGLTNISPVGQRVPLHHCAEGKAILAECSDEEISEYIESQGLSKSTKFTIDKPNELFDDIQMIRERGYSISLQEQIEKVSAIAAAAEDPESGLQGAIAIAGPANQFTVDYMRDNLSEDIIDAANKIDLQLTYGKK